MKALGIDKNNDIILIEDTVVSMPEPFMYQFDMEGRLLLRVAKLREDAFLPEYEHKGDSGFSLRIPEDITILPQSWTVIPLGLKFEPPINHEVQIRSRSGRTAKQGLVVAQGAGTVDQPYRGDVGVILYNRSDSVYYLKRGEAVAQGVLAYVPPTRIEEVSVEEMSETTRGHGGYGSTGA